jgi:signal transduction histidine kinase
MTRLPKNVFFRASLIIAIIVGLTLLVFPNFIRGLFSSEGFMPHSHCYFNNPRMIWLHVISDTLIGLAYVCISSTLGFLVFRASRDIPFHWMFLAFGLFIVSCGFTHFMEVWTVWDAVYWLAGYVKVITAAASVATAIALFPLVPKIFNLINAVKVSEQRRLNLIAANQELEAFASSISHDLRAPLRTMQGMAIALKQDFGPSLAPEAQGYANKIISASERMDVLIQDLLEYSRMNLSEFALVPIDLKSTLDEAVSMLAANIKERNATLTFEGEFPSVLANRHLLLQVTSNLLTNAMKFVVPGVSPQIIIRGELKETRVRLSIQDNGLGIAPRHQERIFKMFERLHPTAEYPGTGIGLAIVQRGVARLGGVMGLESELGKGSCFWLELPRALNH